MAQVVEIIVHIKDKDPFMRRLCYEDNNMTVDDLATQGAKASTAMASA